MLKTRYYFIDTIRGISLCSMVAYHTMFDIFYIFSDSSSWFDGWQGRLWQQSICWCFIIISGMSWCLGEKHLKRGIINLAAGALLTFVTGAFMPSMLIVYGILTFIGCATIIMIPLDKFFKKINPCIGLFSSLLLYFVTQNINSRSLGIAGITFVTLPDFLYSTPFLNILGFTQPSFYSADYFPILPWIFIYCFGYFLFKAIKSERIKKALQIKIMPFAFIGKHSLIIYLLHQPIIYGVLYLIYSF